MIVLGTSDKYYQHLQGFGIEDTVTDIDDNPWANLYKG